MKKRPSRVGIRHIGQYDSSRGWANFVIVCVSRFNLTFAWCALPLVVALATTILTGQTQSEPSDDDLRNRIEAYLAPFVDSGNFTGAVLISRHGKVLLRQAYGLANYELGVPNSPRMRFHIASVSKPFTAAAILQLQEKGGLRLSDTVSRFLPDFPEGDKIRLENLLTHTSGIRDINDLADYDDFARSPHTPPELVAKFAGLPLQFQPGAKYSYSNSNYNLLALILERVSGESYPDYLRRHIFGPAGMEESGHDGDAATLIPLAAAGYEPAGEKGTRKPRTSIGRRRPEMVHSIPPLTIFTSSTALSTSRSS